jgi:hypothetical protein
MTQTLKTLKTDNTISTKPQSQTLNQINKHISTQEQSHTKTYTKTQHFHNMKNVTTATEVRRAVRGPHSGRPKDTCSCATFRHKDTCGCATLRQKDTCGCATFRQKDTCGCATYRLKDTCGCATFRHKDTRCCATFRQKDTKRQQTSHK